MPKEIVGNRYPNSTQFVTEVMWGRDSHVQIATVNTGEPEMAEVRGWHADLDREGINRLIRTLRKARDQAYGADA